MDERCSSSGRTAALICEWPWRRSGSAVCGGCDYPPAAPNWSTKPAGTRATGGSLAGSLTASPPPCATPRGSGARTATRPATCPGSACRPWWGCSARTPGSTPSRVPAVYRQASEKCYLTPYTECMPMLHCHTHSTVMRILGRPISALPCVPVMNTHICYLTSFKSQHSILGKWLINL